MRQFKDAKGREWSIEMSVTSARRAKGLAEVDFLRIADGHIEGLNPVMSDAALLCDALYALCKPQADALGVDAESFGEGMAGDAISDATSALLGELVAFTPNPRMRAALQRVLNAVETAQALRLDRMEKELGPALEAAISGATSGASQAS